MDGVSLQTGARVSLQLNALIGEKIEQAIRLDFLASNNETEYEAILARIEVAKSISPEKLIIPSDFLLIVGQINEEYETQDQCMIRYARLIKK